MSITCPSNESNVRGKSANKERGTTVIVGKGSNDLVLGEQGGNYEIMKSTCKCITLCHMLIMEVQ